MSSECVEGTLRLMRSGFDGPVNIGSEEMVTINQLADMIMLDRRQAGGEAAYPGPLGVRGRNSDNRLIREKLGWAPIAAALGRAGNDLQPGSSGRCQETRSRISLMK